jgi:hypothetical protein
LSSPSSAENGTSSPAAIFHRIAIVGLVLAVSTCDRLARDTPERRAMSSSE